MTIMHGCFRLVQTVPDAILQWIGGRDDDSIGVESHGDKVGGVIAGVRGKTEILSGRPKDKTKPEGDVTPSVTKAAENKLGSGNTSSM